MGLASVESRKRGSEKLVISHDGFERQTLEERVKTALILGITGQDGAYLAHLLLGKGYRVVGSSRDAQMANTSRLERLGIVGQVEVVSLAPNDFRSVLKVVSGVKPDEIYNLAGQTSVGLSFEQPVECMESIAGGTLNLLEVIRYLGTPVRLFNAGSSECFGDTGREPANEDTSFKPRSPYAVAKSTAFWQVANYREAYGLFACTGILANHESPLRTNRFVAQKIIQGVQAIAEGKQEKLVLGNLDIWRDWGWAPEYVEAMYRMLQADTPMDYVIASEKSHSLQEFVDAGFEHAGLHLQGRLEVASSLMRPTDLSYSAMDPSKIEKDLGWKADLNLESVVEKMMKETIP
jgi:GDPmannose 4,6-dehydratase